MNDSVINILPESVPVRPTLWQSAIQRLTRVTSGRRLIPCVDGLRCLAILAVIIYHLNGYLVGKCSGFTEADARQTWIFHLVHGSNCGVQLFFAISGFILALPFARERLDGEVPVSLKHYYFRRLTRLEPPFLINLAIVFCLLVFLRRESLSDLMAPLAATMTYTHNWIYGVLNPVNGVTWSLEIEVQFYVLAPFLTRWYFTARPEWRWKLICSVILTWMAVKSVYLVNGPVVLRLGLLYTLDHFLTGVLLADLYVHRWKEAPQQHMIWDLFFALSLPAMFLIQLNPHSYHLLPIISALLLTAAFRGPWTNRLFSVPLFVVTGGMCYSIYLYHFFVISLIGRLTVPLTGGAGYLFQLFAQTAMIVPATILVCAFFFVAFEKRFMKWRPLAPSPR